MNSSTDKSWPAIRRAWIERRAARTGTINRQAITAALGISAAQASGDIQELLRQPPECMTYDLSVKTYRWSPAHKPLLPLPEWMADFILEKPQP